MTGEGNHKKYIVNANTVPIALIIIIDSLILI